MVVAAKVAPMAASNQSVRVRTLLEVDVLVEVVAVGRAGAGGSTSRTPRGVLWDL